MLKVFFFSGNSKHEVHRRVYRLIAQIILQYYWRWIIMIKKTVNEYMEIF